MSMGGTWVMLRCQCGRNFGSRAKSIFNCPSCNNKTSLTTVKSFSSSSELREAVSRANVPVEIANELALKLSSYEKSERNKEAFTINDIEEILSHAQLPDNTITLGSVDESMRSLNLNKMSAERLIDFLEASSLVLRNTNNTWSILQ
jgi:transcription elongation factor Elf1|tara:strand:- start:80 stop:520 length:441 start_codon:yes stop_codon:yes gene_type:complete